MAPLTHLLQTITNPFALMDLDTRETKVQVRLSTRDPHLQIAEEPTTLLVQTSKFSHMYEISTGTHARVKSDNSL